MRNRYASREMDGMFRAWKVRGDVGVESAVREAEKRVCHIGGRDPGGKEWESGGLLATEVERPSFAVAIWVKSDASSLSKSDVGYA